MNLGQRHDAEESPAVPALADGRVRQVGHPVLHPMVSGLPLPGQSLCALFPPVPSYVHLRWPSRCISLPRNMSTVPT